MVQSSKKNFASIEKALLNKISRKLQSTPCADALRHMHSTPIKSLITSDEVEAADTERLEIPTDPFEVLEDQADEFTYAEMIRKLDDNFLELQISKLESDEARKITTIQFSPRDDDQCVADYQQQEHKKSLYESQKNLEYYFRELDRQNCESDAPLQTQKDFRNPARLFSKSVSLDKETITTKKSLQR